MSMLAIVATSLLTGLLSPRTGAADAAADFKALCAKIATEKNYAFESSLDSDAPAPGGKSDATPVEGKVEVGFTSELKHGETLAYRHGEKLVYKKKDAWEVYSPPAAGGGGGRGGKYGGGGGGGDVKEMAAIRTIVMTPLPHELLARLPIDLSGVEVAEANGKQTFTGTLSEAAAMKISGADRLHAPPAAPAGKGGGGGAAKPVETKASGKATVVFGKDGHPEKLVVETHVKAQQGEFKQKITATLKDWGAAKFEAPKEAMSKLNG